MTIHEALIPLKENAIAATFADETTARTAYDSLRAHGFEHVWLATTKPADGEGNEVADSSEGLLGAIGRFFSGEGSSLRRSLEDHGVDPVDASEIDDALPPLGAVVTAFAGNRMDLAVEILRTYSMHVYLPDSSALKPIGAPGVSPVATPLASSIAAPDEPGISGLRDPAGTTSTLTSRVLVDASPVPGMPGALEQVFVERRIVAPTTTRAGDVSTSTGLNDLL